MYPFYTFYKEQNNNFNTIFEIDFLLSLIKRFSDFLIYKLWKEDLYQFYLYEWLKVSCNGDGLDFNIKREYWLGKEKVDILFETNINKIGIEIKWPTKKSSFRSLPKQIIQYMDFCDYLVLVFFEIQEKINIEKEIQKIIKGLNPLYKDRIVYITI